MRRLWSFPILTYLGKYVVVEGAPQQRKLAYEETHSLTEWAIGAILANIVSSRRER